MSLPTLQETFEQFAAHYAKLWETSVSVEKSDAIYTVRAPNVVKPGNEPRILHHGKPTEEVIILTHGLSDSPFYVLAIARRFFDWGCNVVLPLLPAHGLIHPDEAFEDFRLDRKWKATIDHAVSIAQQLGQRISIGGFSTGGALSLNKILRNPEDIHGGLFLFSGALDLGNLVEGGGQIRFLQAITKLVDGKVSGFGRDPYKYPTLPFFGGAELAQIIKENNRLLKRTILHQKVFAAQSVHDTTVKIDGLIDFMKRNVQTGVTFLIAQNVSHSELVLDQDVTPDDSQTAGPVNPPRANPKFEWMMYNVQRFFEEEVKGNEIS